MLTRFDSKKSIKEDKFGLGNYVEEFVNTFIDSDFSGPVFVHGKWGSGKTTFANFVVELLKKRKLKIKVNYLSIWKSINTECIYECIYKELFRISYWIFLFFTFPAIIISTYFLVYLSFSSTQITAVPIFLIILISLSVLFTKYLDDKLNREEIFEALLKSSINFKQSRQRLIILDDIDRIDKDNQIKLYPILDNLISNKVKLIILGDINKVELSNSPFILKILNMKFSIETKTNSYHSWEYLINELNEMINNLELPLKISDKDKEDINSLQELFCVENRTVREAIILLEHLKLFYFKYKINKVNIGQFFIMIYIYSFSPKLYEYILLNRGLFTKIDVFSFSTGHQYEKDLENKMKEFESQFPSYSELVFIKLFKMKTEGILLSQSKYYQPVIDNTDSFSRYMMEFTNEHLDILSVQDRINHNDETTFEKFGIEEFISFIQFIRSEEIKGIDDTLFCSTLINYIKFYFTDYVQDLNRSESGFLMTSRPEQLMRDFVREFKERKLLVIKLIREIISTNIDISQICNITPKFTTDKVEQLEIVKQILDDSKSIDIKAQKKLIYFMFFYKIFYIELHRNDIDSEINSIFELNDYEFVEFVEKKLTTTSYTLGSSTPNYHLNLELISFSVKFSDDFGERIQKIKDDKIKEKLTSLQDDSMF